MKRTAIALAFVTLAQCSGPAASDAALCRDIIRRLCAAPICPSVTTSIPFTGDCESALILRTGCDNEAFMWRAPLDRDTLLTCRLPIIRSSDNINELPDCLDVAESFSDCPALVSFLAGGTL